MDEELRRAEREFLSDGTPEAEERFIRYCARKGLHFRNHKREEILTEWEEVQADYDEIAWHARKALRWGWDWDPRGGLVKAHHTWGHRGWSNRNSKRKTLRTHRNGKHKARNYRPPKERKPKKQEAPHEKRRKKRFAGRERLYGVEREWEWDENWRIVSVRIVYYYRVPDSVV
jgi:hypothetical protein